MLYIIIYTISRCKINMIVSSRFTKLIEELEASINNNTDSYATGDARIPKILIPTQKRILKKPKKRHK